MDGTNTYHVNTSHTNGSTMKYAADTTTMTSSMFFLSEEYDASIREMAYKDMDNATLHSMDTQTTTTGDFQQFVTWLNNIGIPLICLLGMIANILCVLAYCRTTLRVQSSSFYLVCLAIVHLLYLVRFFISWLEHLTLISTDNVVACPLLAYSLYVLTFSSAWILVALTTERLIIVYFPHRRHVWCKKRTAKIVISCIVSIACLLYTFCFVTTGLEQHGDMSLCTPREQYDHVTQRMRYTDAIITFLVPSAIMIMFDIAIGCKIRSFICQRPASNDSDKIPYSLQLELSEQSVVLRTCSEHAQLCQRHTNTSIRSHSVCEYHKPTINETLKQDFHLRSTRAFLWASVCYLVLYLPINTVNFFMIFAEVLGISGNYGLTMVHVIHCLHFISYINFGSTCFLFWCRNRSSRQALVRLFKLETWTLPRPSRLSRTVLRNNDKPQTAANPEKF